MLRENEIWTGACGRLIPPFTTAQQSLYEALNDAIGRFDLIFVDGFHGSGKTNIASLLWREDDSRYKVCVRSTLSSVDLDENTTYQQVIEDRIVGFLSDKATVVVDDLFRYGRQADGAPCPPGDMVDMLQRALSRSGPGKTIVATVGEGELPEDFVFDESLKVKRLRIPRFDAEDYRQMFAHAFGEANIGGVDFELVHRLAKPLSAFHVVMICSFLHTDGIKQPTTPEVVEMLGEHLLKPGTDMREVNAILLTNQAGLFCSV